MAWKTYAQHTHSAIGGGEITPYVSPLREGHASMPRRIEDSDYYKGGPTGAVNEPMYEGMELYSGKPKIVFGEDVLCPSCKGTRVDTPMSGPEAQERRRIKTRAKRQGIVAPQLVRWECQRCGGSGLANVND